MQCPLSPAELINGPVSARATSPTRPASSAYGVPTGYSYWLLVFWYLAAIPAVLLVAPFWMERVSLACCRWIAALCALPQSDRL